MFDRLKKTPQASGKVEQEKAFNMGYGQLGLNPLENWENSHLRRGSGVCTTLGEGYSGGPLILWYFQSATSRGGTALTGQESPQVSEEMLAVLSLANIHRNGSRLRARAPEAPAGSGRCGLRKVGKREMN